MSKLVSLIRENKRLREAITRIAMFDDMGANAKLDATGSYGRFDEPGSVQVAREALQPDTEIVRADDTGSRLPAR